MFDPMCILYIKEGALRCEYPLMLTLLSWFQSVHIVEVSLFISWSRLYTSISHYEKTSNVNTFAIVPKCSHPGGFIVIISWSHVYILHYEETSNVNTKVFTSPSLEVGGLINQTYGKREYRRTP